ncbi:MAG: hypothetical protein IT302_11710 [Dehalococcoidia bacterium]|nr:hypothetical protein [Dehalococcoidia bacterium]
MIILLYGADQLAIDRRMRQLRDEADGGTGMLATNLTVFDGRDARPAEIAGAAMSPPFLSPQRLVVVDHIFSRFESNPGEGRRAGRSLDAVAPLLTAIERGLPPTTVLVFKAARVAPSNPLLAALKKLPGVSIEEQPELKNEALTRYIRDEANARGLRFRSGPPRTAHPSSQEWDRATAQDPVTLIGILTGGETLAIANELDKLALYTMGRDATIDDVYELCSGQREFTAFALTDAVMDGRLLDALSVLEALRSQGESTPSLLALLMAAYRRLGPVIDLREQGVSPDEIGKATGLKWQGLRDAAIRRADGLGQAGLAAAFAALVEADRRQKLGEIDDDLALEVAIGKLASAAAAAAKRQARPPATPRRQPAPPRR